MKYLSCKWVLFCFFFLGAGSAFVYADPIPTSENLVLSITERAKIGEAINSDFKLGDTKDQIEAVWGQPDVDAAGPYFSWCSYKKRKVNYLEHAMLGVVRIESKDRSLQNCDS
jgi:hypothetical protein